MDEIVVLAFVILIGASALSGVLAIILAIALIFIKDFTKRQSIGKWIKILLLTCIISFCIGFGLCSYSWSQIDSWN